MGADTSGQKWLERTIGDALLGVPDDWDGPHRLEEANAVRYLGPQGVRALTVRTGRWESRRNTEAERVRQFADLNRSSLAAQGFDVEGVDELDVRRSNSGVHVLGQVGFGWIGSREPSNYTVFYALHCHFPGRELLTIQVSSTGAGETVGDVGEWALAFLQRFNGFLPHRKRL